MGTTSATVILAVDHETEVVLGRIEVGRAGLALIDALMRFELDARRCGCEVRLRDVTEELRGLLALVGLEGAVAIEPRREPEGGKDLGVDEVVQPGNPAV